MIAVKVEPPPKEALHLYRQLDATNKQFEKHHKRSLHLISEVLKLKPTKPREQKFKQYLQLRRTLHAQLCHHLSSIDTRTGTCVAHNYQSSLDELLGKSTTIPGECSANIEHHSPTSLRSMSPNVPERDHSSTVPMEKPLQSLETTVPRITAITPPSHPVQSVRTTKPTALQPDSKRGIGRFTFC